MERTEVKLAQSICTEVPTGVDIYQYGDETAQHVKNTGIERAGGITNLYEQESTFTTAGVSTAIARDGTVVQIDSNSNVRLNDTVIGNVGPYSVTSRGAIKAYSDAAWTASNTIIGIVKIGSAIRVDEINPATGAILNTRSITFTILSAAMTNIALIKYIGMNYSDSLGFIVSNNSASYYLRESDTSTSAIGGQTWTQHALSGLYNSAAWSPVLGLFGAVGLNGANCAASSPDGATWTLRALASLNYTSVSWATNIPAFVGIAALSSVTSLDGTTWTPHVISQTGLVSICYSPLLLKLVAVGTGGTGSYAATSIDGVTFSSQALEANSWRAVCYTSATIGYVTVGAGATHYAAISADGATWFTQTLSAATWQCVCWSPEQKKIVALGLSGGGTAYYGTSFDGQLWTVGTLPSGNWTAVTWIPQLSQYVGVGATGSGANYSVSSPDGQTWTVQTLASLAWSGLAWSPDLSVLAAVAAVGGGTLNSATAIQLITGSNFGWKFAANKYIVGNQGVSGSFYNGDVAGAMTAITDATWGAIDIFAGTAFSRAILSFNVKKNTANLLTGIGEVGYNQTGTFTATATYYGVALAAVTVTITNNISGPGYSEATFVRSDTGTNIYYYQAPIMGHNPGQWFDYHQSQTQTLCNGYGRLSDFNGNTLGNTCSLRVGMINGQPSYLSAGVIGQANTSPLDCLGVPVTNVGEIDELYLPHVTDNGSSRLNCIYRYNGILFFFVIQSGSLNTLQAVSDNLYMVNCLSPINAIDVRNKTLNLGANDYNGRILFRSAAAIITTAKAVGIMQGDYANSIDSGDKLITQTFSTATNIIPAIELPSFIDRAVNKYGVNIYLADVYSVTYQSFNVDYVNGNLVGVTYVPDTRIPLGMGYTFYLRVMQTEIETILTGVGVTGNADIDYDYLCYETGNDTPGQYQSFVLFGQTFLFDGKQIWFASFSGSLFSGKGNSPVAPAEGMALIASSPLRIYFLSSFDNSIYVFDGGRSLQKIHRMNQIETILNGVYSVRDNTLALQTANNFIWIRDDLISENAKKANQTAVSIFPTSSGVVIVNNTAKWTYSFTPLTGPASTVVPLDFQTAYFGLRANMIGQLTGWMVYVYSSTKTALTLSYTLYAMDSDSLSFKVQSASQTITPAMFDQNGIALVRVQPGKQKAIATSLEIKCSGKVTVTKIVPEFRAIAPAAVSPAQSK